MRLVDAIDKTRQNDLRFVQSEICRIVGTPMSARERNGAIRRIEGVLSPFGSGEKYVGPTNPGVIELLRTRFADGTFDQASVDALEEQFNRALNLEN